MKLTKLPRGSSRGLYENNFLDGSIPNELGNLGNLDHL